MIHTISSAVKPAVSFQRWILNIRTELLGFTPEVIGSSLFVGQEVSCWNEDVVCVYSLAGVWKI